MRYLAYVSNLFKSQNVAQLTLPTSKVAGLITCFICSRLHHEKWQLVGFTILQTALIGSMASVTADTKTQAIVTVVLAATTITPPQLLSFTMLSFGLEDQSDL